MKEYRPIEIAPVVRNETFKDYDKKAFVVPCFVTDVMGAEYDVCQEYAKNCWSNSKKGSYGSGILNQRGDRGPFATERTGKLFEMGFAKMFGLAVDVEYHKGGKKFDFVLPWQDKSRFIELKGSAEKPDIAFGYVPKLDEHGTTMPVESFCYVFGYLESDDFKSKVARVVVVGSTNRTVVTMSPVRPTRDGRLNYNVDFRHLSKIGDLYDKWDTYRKAGAQVGAGK